MACIIPLGQLLGYSLSPPLMLVMAKRAQYLLSTGLMALATLGLALTFHWRVRSSGGSLGSDFLCRPPASPPPCSRWPWGHVAS